MANVMLVHKTAMPNTALQKARSLDVISKDSNSARLSLGLLMVRAKETVTLGQRKEIPSMVRQMDLSSARPSGGSCLALQSLDHAKANARDAEKWASATAMWMMENERD